jgi:hypothetical protein
MKDDEGKVIRKRKKRKNKDYRRDSRELCILTSNGWTDACCSRIRLNDEMILAGKRIQSLSLSSFSLLWPQTLFISCWIFILDPVCFRSLFYSWYAQWLFKSMKNCTACCFEWRIIRGCLSSLSPTTIKPLLTSKTTVVFEIALTLKLLSSILKYEKLVQKEKWLEMMWTE